MSSSASHPTTTTHTPGPWQVSDAPPMQFGHCFIGFQVWGRTRVAFMEIQNCGSDEAEANARLIAAAPELLSALHQVVAAFRTYSLEAGARNAMVMVAKAITKAEGW